MILKLWLLISILSLVLFSGCFVTMNLRIGFDPTAILCCLHSLCFAFHFQWSWCFETADSDQPYHQSCVNLATCFLNIEDSKTSLSPWINNDPCRWRAIIKIRWFSHVPAMLESRKLGFLGIGSGCLILALLFGESFLHVTWWSGWLTSLLRGLLEQQGQHQPPWNDQFLCRWRLVAEGIVAAIIYLYLMLNADIWQVISVVHGTLDEVVHWRSFNIFHSSLWSCSWDSAIREEIISETKGFKLRPAWTHPSMKVDGTTPQHRFMMGPKWTSFWNLGHPGIYIYTPHFTCRSGDEIDSSCYRTYGFNMENHKGVSKNRGGPPKSSILIRFSI